MPKQEVVAPAGYVSINHNLGFFLDPEKYVPIANISDESAVLLKLGLIIENFLTVFIENIRDPETQGYVQGGRYFKQKLDLCVALGLPVTLAQAIETVNSFRNKFAHDLDYVITDDDFNLLEKKVNAVSESVVNKHSHFNIESVRPMFTDGVNSLQFIKEMPYTTSVKQRRILKLVGLVYILSNKCAFYTLNDMAAKKRLSIGAHK